MSLSAVLLDMGLSQYQPKLDLEAVDLEALVLLGATDLRAVIGLPLGHAAKLIYRAQDTMGQLASCRANRHCASECPSAAGKSADDVREYDASRRSSRDSPMWHREGERPVQAIEISPVVCGEELRCGSHRSPQSAETVQTTHLACPGFGAARVAPVALPASSIDEGPGEDWATIAEELIFDAKDDNTGARAVEPDCDAGEGMNEAKPKLERLPIRSSFRSCFRALGYLCRIMNWLDFIMVADHQWCFKVCLILGQRDDAVKAHMMHMVEIWTIVYSVLLGSVIEIWSMRPDEGDTQELIIFECLSGTCTMLTVLTIIFLAVFLVVLSAVHPNNIKGFLIGAAGPVQLVEIMINLSAYSLLFQITYVGWLRLAVVAPGHVISRWIVPACTFVVVVGFYASAHILSKLAMHGGLMTAECVTGNVTETDPEERIETVMFERVWAQASKTRTTGAAALHHLRCAERSGSSHPEDADGHVHESVSAKRPFRPG